MKLKPRLKHSIRAVLYVRVSSKGQEKEGFSIPAQLKLLRQSADRDSCPDAWFTTA